MRLHCTFQCTGRSSGTRIGELAARSEVPAKTIRFYEELGVLTEADRTESGYRDFGEEALPRLAFKTEIRHMPDARDADRRASC